MSDSWTEIEPAKKYRRRDGWVVATDANGAVHLVTPKKSEAFDEDGRRVGTFDSPAAAMDFADHHHPLE